MGIFWWQGVGDEFLTPTRGHHGRGEEEEEKLEGGLPTRV